MENPFQAPVAGVSPVRVRFAPSPTGFLHIGGLRTALYNELLANRHQGDFILRIEDTDRARFVEGGIENICRSLEACGVIPNEGVWLEDGKVIERGTFGPYIQSKRQPKHLAYAEELITMGKAYYCFCSSERLEELREEQQKAGKPTMYDGRCRELSHEESRGRVGKGETHVVRLKLPKSGSVKVWDIIRDDIDFDWGTIDDQVIIKSDGMPTYHLAATCDDHDMEISHVIRGEEWLPSTPKHLFIYEAFGWTPPKFAHLPLLLNADRSKLSKRQGDVAVEDYLAKGYLPEALINFVALLGWNPTSDREVYTHDELIEMFDIAKVNKAGAVFNIEKLDWLNAHYLRSIPVGDYFDLTRPFVEGLSHDDKLIARALLIARDRITKPQDVKELVADYLVDHIDYSGVSIPWKTQQPSDAIERLTAVRDLITSCSDEDLNDVSAVEMKVKALITEKGWGNGDTLWPLRVALSGKEKSPTPFELVVMYGKATTIARIDDAIHAIS